MDYLNNTINISVYNMCKNLPIICDMMYKTTFIIERNKLCILYHM